MQRERDIPLREHPENARRIPAGIAKFEAVPALARQHIEKTREPVPVRPEVRRELKKDRADLVSEQGKSVFEELETISGAFR
jgi:hypothetical protein